MGQPQPPEPNWAYEPPPIIPGVPPTLPQRWPATTEPSAPATYQGGIYQPPAPIPAWPPAAQQQPVQQPPPAPGPAYVYVVPQQPLQQQINVNTRVNVGSGPNHLLHLILTLCTCGLWAPIWIIIAIAGRKR